MKVPFNQIGAQYLEEQEETERVITEVLKSGTYIGGPFVSRFEADFSAYHGAKYTVGCASGTDALYLALRAVGIGPGDEVITTAYSWISTAMAISLTGATPVFVDIDTHDFQMDMQLAEEAVTSKTRAILPVYLYGAMGKRDAAIAFAKKHELALIEDAAQVHGIQLCPNEELRHHLICFSFYPTKQLGAVGDAGAILVDEEHRAIELRKLANLGSLPAANKFEKIGINSRLDPIQAAVLSLRLQQIDQRYQRRNALSKIYNELLTIGAGEQNQAAQHAYYQYVIRVKEREELMAHLDKHQVGYAVHYPYTLPGTAAYGNQIGFDQAERAVKEVLSLPIDPSLSDDQIVYVCDVINQLVA